MCVHLYAARLLIVAGATQGAMLELRNALACANLIGNKQAVTRILAAMSWLRRV